ncbi:MAG: MerR family transcriptional regulator [Anaerovoracaceae bacterium]
MIEKKQWKISDVSIMFDIPIEVLRYYEKEGILSPKRNNENNYRTYTAEDLIKLADILFYRDVDLPIKDIKKITHDLPVNKISEIIESRSRFVEEQLKKYKQLSIKLKTWENLHNESIEFFDKYDIRPMPKAYIKGKTYRTSAESLDALFLDDNISREEIYSLFFAFSFYYKKGIMSEIEHYIVYEETSEKIKITKAFKEGIIEENPSCLFTVVEKEELKEKFQGLFEYAKKNKIKLTGECFARLSVVHYSESEYQEIYRIYAPIK